MKKNNKLVMMILVSILSNDGKANQESLLNESNLLQKQIEKARIALNSKSVLRIDKYDQQQRNPFMLPLATINSSSNVIEQDCRNLTAKEMNGSTVLEEYSITQLVLKGVMGRNGIFIALVQIPKGELVSIIEGNYLGVNQGKVIQINSKKVVINDRVLNAVGCMEYRNVEWVLQ